jgi:16S rRNA G966 N2-methylase RsmD
MLKRLFARIVHVIHLLAYSWRAVGPRAIARHLVAWSSDAEARRVDSGFDAKYGTDTNADLTPREAGIPVARRHTATMYLPTMDRDLDAMFDALAWPAARLRETTFVDLGSGKGRVVMLAAMRELREVVGVELAPVLHEVAQRNVALVEQQLVSPVRLELGDATELDIPSGPLIVYLYHPFRDTIAAAVLGRLVAALESSPRPAAILYGHPTLQRCLDRDLFGLRGVFRAAADGERRTKKLRIGWTVWTNEAWLDEPLVGDLVAVPA